MNVVVAKTSSQNEGDLIFLESLEGLTLSSFKSTASS